MTPAQHSELATRLRREVRGEVLFDDFSRGRYATDASIYQMMPRGVVLPKSVDDVRACIAIARETGTPVLARGGGTSQCGQTVNDALVLDNSRYLDRVLALDVENRRCVVQPGIVLDELNRQLAPHGLWFPVDVSTSSRATIGGMAANNSCGQRSIHYGTMRHNVHAIEAILPGGEEFRFGEVGPDLRGVSGAQRELYADLLEIGRREADEIAARFPRLLRRVGGYNVDALVPGNTVHNLSHLLVGSEGTLGYSTALELKLSPIPANRVLGVCHFPTFYQAMDAAQHLVALKPHAVELVDDTMIALAREIDMFRATIERFVRGAPAALLLVEFAFDDQAENLRSLELLEERMAELGFTWGGSGKRLGGVVAVVDKALQGAVAEVRKAGLNIMMSMKSEGKPVSFVEDCAVELPDLAEYTARLTDIFTRHGTRGTWYAHASVGCLHVRPVLNMKLEKDAATMRAIAEEAFDMVLAYKGSHSGEHGDGIARSEFHEKMFGPRMVRTFEEVKTRIDPQYLFNPGKIVHAPRLDDRSLFRYAPGYRMRPFSPAFDWSAWNGEGGGLQGAVEMCNNNGACRKLQGGVMCPSYRVTRDERDVTRGRANTLRLALTGQLGEEALFSDAMGETLKLCVSCKACKRECPTGVDMARMKIEVLAARGARLGFTLHERLVAHLPRYAPFAARLRGLLNLRNRLPALARASERLTGFAAGRELPRWRGDWFGETAPIGTGEREVVLFADTFNTWFEPENLRAARTVLAAAGYRVHVAHRPGERRLCCGRTYLTTGMIEQARREARRTVDALWPWVERGATVVGLEPSCLFSLRDEFPGLLPGEKTAALAERALLLEEFLAAESARGALDLALEAPAAEALLHGHCHQKAFGVMGDVEATLALIPGLAVTRIESSCCGMAGAFGYAAETVGVSRRMAEMDLLPAVRASAEDTLIVADGTSCRQQIGDGTGRRPLHVARVLEMALKSAT